MFSDNKKIKKNYNIVIIFNTNIFTSSLREEKYYLIYAKIFKDIFYILKFNNFFFKFSVLLKLIVLIILVFLKTIKVINFYKIFKKKCETKYKSSFYFICSQHGLAMIFVNMIKKYQYLDSRIYSLSYKSI